MAQKSICFYFQVHQPFRVSKWSFFKKEEENPDYFEGLEGYENKAVFEKVARKCYLPMNAVILELLETHPEFRASFSLSGVFLEQCELYGEIGEAVLDSFKKLVATGRVEILSETYHHSLSFLYSKHEFVEQVMEHYKKVYEHFKVRPKVFRNTELIFSDEVAEVVRNLGFKGIIAEGWDPILKGHSPNHIRNVKRVELHPEDQKILKKFAPRNILGRPKKQTHDIKVLTKNYKLSDDVAFRFGNKEWEEHPLFADKYAHWLDSTDGETINLFMDYETFGEHQWEDTGIFDFMRHMPGEAIKKGITFRTPSETIEHHEPRGELSAPDYYSWADEARDLSAWLENDLQKAALQEIHEIEKSLHGLKKSRSKVVQKIISDFKKLQTSDHLYYMCTKYWSDGDVHAYFSPFDSPYDAFINYMNVLESLKKRIVDITKV